MPTDEKTILIGNIAGGMKLAGSRVTAIRRGGRNRVVLLEDGRLMVGPTKRIIPRDGGILEWQYAYPEGDIWGEDLTSTVIREGDFRQAIQAHRELPVPSAWKQRLRRLIGKHEVGRPHCPDCGGSYFRYQLEYDEMSGRERGRWWCFDCGWTPQGLGQWVRLARIYP